uniref:Immunoglobulin C1-set domain-containing protein n=1 Tax=Sinocyclocheilus grahami TaxID=75366 RepID=A0A672M7G9_SINGR
VNSNINSTLKLKVTLFFSLIANQEQKLICTVHNIYPLERFHIEWLRGDKTLHKEELDVQNLDHVQNYSSVFNYTPSVDDLGKNISCKAILNLSGLEKTTTAECKSMYVRMYVIIKEIFQVQYNLLLKLVYCSCKVAFIFLQ